MFLSKSRCREGLPRYLIPIGLKARRPIRSTRPAWIRVDAVGRHRPAGWNAGLLRSGQPGILIVARKTRSIGSANRETLCSKHAETPQ